MESSEVRDKPNKLEMTKDQEKLLNQTAENANENSKKTNGNSTSG